MSVRPVLRMGDPRLLVAAAAVEDFDTPSLHALITDLHDTMQARGGVGIAAPQIGVSLQVIVFGFERSQRYPDAAPVPLTVLLNPHWEALHDTCAEDWEGCLSVPGLRGKVPRATHIAYRGHDPRGRLIEREARDFHARLVQHECDHLHGTLFPMRVRDLRQFGYTDVLFPALKPPAADANPSQ